MSEHIDSLPIFPPESPTTVDISTLPPVPPTLTEEKLDLHNEVIESFIEHQQNVMDESSRLLNEVHESDKLVDEQQKALELTPIKDEPIEKLEVSDLVIDVKTLSSLVALFIADEPTETQSLSIPSEVKVVLYELLSMGDFYDDVEQLLKDIVRDDKIDAQDVPKLMVLIVRLYEILRSTTITFDAELCGSVLKTLFRLAIDEQLIPISNEDIHLLNCLFDIVDTSVRLLAMQTTNKKRKGILHSIAKLFNGCK